MPAPWPRACCPDWQPLGVDLRPPLLPAGRGGEGQGVVGLNSIAGVNWRGCPAASAFLRGTDRLSPLLFGWLPWWKKPELYLEATLLFNKRGCRPLLTLEEVLVNLSSSLAGRGSEGRRGEFSCFSCAGGGVPRCAAVTCVSLPARWLFHRALHLRLPPPAHGWCGEFDGGPSVVVGSGVDPPSATAVQLLWCWKSSSSSSTSSAGESRHASKILRGSILKPTNGSGKKTSTGRPFSRSASAFNVGWEASGVVRASFLDGG
jgi:hypothetical protein